MSAGNIKLNLKEFKHVSSDKNSTTLQHKQGHKLVLAHNSLSPESKAQLQELAKGGKPCYDDGGIVDAASQWYHKQAAAGTFGTGPQSTEQAETLKSYTQHPENRPIAKAKGGKIQHYFKGEENVRNYGDKDYNPPPPQKQAQDMPDASPLHTSSSRTSEEAKSQQDVSTKSQNDSRAAWDPDYKPNMAQGGPTPDPMRPCLNPNCKSHGQHHPNCRCYGGMAQGGYVESRDQDEQSGKEEYFCDMPRHHFKGCEYVMAKGGRVSDKEVKKQREARDEMPLKASGTNEGFHQKGGQTPIGQMQRRSSLQEYKRSPGPNIKGLKDGGSPEDAPDMKDDVERGFHHQYIEPDKEESQDEQNKGLDKEIEDAANYVNPTEQQPQAAAPMAPEAQPQEQPAASTIQPDATQPTAQDQQAVQPQPAQAQQAQQDASTNPIQRFADHKQMNQKSLLDEDAAWANDLQNGHIKPMTYQSLFADKSTPGKIGTLFGLLLSGAGSGLSHQPNALLEMMKQTINNDLTAQQNSKVNAENYLRLGQSHALNMANAKNLDAEAQTKAYALAKMRMNRAGLQAMVDNVNKMPTGPQKQQAQAALAMLNNGVQNENYDIADRAATASAYMKMLGVGPGQNESASNQSEAAFQQQQRNRTLLGPEGKQMADMAIDRHIPNLPPNVAGQASYPVPQGIRDQIHAQNVLDNKGKDLLDFVKQHSGTWNPQTIAQAKQKIEEMKNFYNGSISGGALTAGRLKWYDEQFKENPTSIVNQLIHGSSKRLEEVVNSNAMRRDQQLKDLGFTVKQPQQAPKEVVSKSGRPIVYRDGKAYYK